MCFSTVNVQLGAREQLSRGIAAAAKLRFVIAALAQQQVLVTARSAIFSRLVCAHFASSKQCARTSTYYTRRIIA